MDRIFMAALGGACVVWGLVLRGQAESGYWRSMKSIADSGKNQEDYLPQLNASRSNTKGNGNLAIGFGVLMIVGMMT